VKSILSDNPELMLELEGLIKDALRKPEAQELVLGE
jgi:hypothetical protein